MTLYDDLLIDAVSLSTGLPADVAVGACVEGPWQFPFLSGDQRGDFPIFQGFDGAGYIDQPYAAWIMPVNLTLSSPACADDVAPEQSDDSWAWINNAIEQVRLLCKPDRPITLTRRRSMPAGNDEQDLAAKLTRITPNRDGRDTLRLVIEFTMLEALWYGDAVVQAVTGGSTTFDVAGTTRTNKIVVRLPAGLSNPRVTDTTNGYTFQWAGGLVPSGGVDVDVLARTATRVTGGTDVSRYLTWSKPHLLRLDPGSNTVTVTGTGAASCTVTYHPAYL